MADKTINSMSISGEAKVRTKNDKAVIQVTVLSKNKLSKKAREGNNEAMRGVFTLLEDNGISKDDYSTSGYSYDEWREQVPSGTGKNKTYKWVKKGYQVTNSVTITIRDMDKLDGLFDAIADIDSNQTDKAKPVSITVEGPHFSVSNPAEVLNEARSLAIQNALIKANIYAKELGVSIISMSSLGERVDAGEDRQGYGKTMLRAASATMSYDSDSESAPVNAGTKQMTIVVNCTFVVSDMVKPANTLKKAKALADKRKQGA